MGALKIPVAVLGATGLVGERFVELLADHPWFEVCELAASDQSVGRRFGERVRWSSARPLDERIALLELRSVEPPFRSPLVFSALDAAVAGPVEEALARAGHVVVTNASPHRMDPRVPLLVPEVDPDHLALLELQDLGGGALVANPNCSTAGLVLALAPLARAFGLRTVQVVTMQALSGAGRTGPTALEMADNLIPFIAGEEEKIERETRKILGVLEGGAVRPADVRISAQCNRVAVLDGHVACVSVELGHPVELDLVRQAWCSFQGEPQELRLPSAPTRPVHVLDREDAPQPRLHRDRDRGMAACVGRLRSCPVLDLRFVVLSHNTLRGAAGGAVLTAELLVARGLGGLRAPRTTA